MLDWSFNFPFKRLLKNDSFSFDKGKIECQRTKEENFVDKVFFPTNNITS